MNLGIVLRKWRVMSELDLRRAARLIGINHVALMRLEHGSKPNADTLLTVLAWLGRRPIAKSGEEGGKRG